tara:strand:+ start:1954 stop:2151 length:198 start_codon:yes stop_codon:yes gene_type:complete
MKFLSRKAVCDLVQLSRAEISRREVDNRFPQGVKLGDFHNSRVVYVQEEVMDWMHEQVSIRDKTH